MTREFAYVTLASMIAPSPDWFNPPFRNNGTVLPMGTFTFVLLPM